MNRQSTWTRTLGICAVILVVWWFVSRKTIMPSPAAAFKAAVVAEPIHVKEKIQVERNLEKAWPCLPPGGKFPGKLTGRWTCKGKSAAIAGAHDDNLVSFKLLAPDNKTLQQLDHPTAGNFEIRFDGPGAYTFVFNNAGGGHSSARVVEFEGTYQPD